MLVALVNQKRKYSLWRVIDKRSTLCFSSKPGPWLLLVPQGEPPTYMNAHWVNYLNDDEYKVMPA